MCYFFLHYMEIDIIDFKSKLESKKTDCEVFSKKHKERNNEGLFQYYEGALWALRYTLKLLEESE